jgi:hypothetical protein
LRLKPFKTLYFNFMFYYFALYSNAYQYHACPVFVNSKSVSSTCHHFTQVSQHTGRIHLYSCVPGHDSRPKPLLENFLPEELEPPSSLSSHAKKTRTQLLKSNPAFCNIFNAFIKEWSALRPIDKRKLHGKPLQLPLSLELCFLKDSLNHSIEVCTFRLN